MSKRSVAQIVVAFSRSLRAGEALVGAPQARVVGGLNQSSSRSWLSLREAGRGTVNPEKLALHRHFSALPQSSANIEGLARSCWFCGECGRKEQKYMCDNCGYLQDSYSDEDFFQVFNMDRAYDIDQNLLERRYKNLQRTLHPDRHATKDKDTQRIAQKGSAHVNDGYNILKCPLARGKYLLELKGMAIDEQARMTDPSFLMKIMELQEEVSQASDKASILVMLEDNLHRRRDYADKVKHAYNNAQWKKMSQLVHELTYYHRIEAQLREKL